MAMDNFGEQFAKNTLRRVYQTANFPAITNTNYEGDIQQAGDRVNILSFPGDAQLQDYAVGTDMDTNTVYDLEDQLVVEKRKSHSFSIDRLEDLFTYVDDASDDLVENVAKTIERTIDSYVLENVQYAKAGNWVGIDLRIAGTAQGTMASITTTSTGGTVEIQGGSEAVVGNLHPIETPDGVLMNIGFETADVGKPIRLTSGTTWATGWYRISGVTDTNTASVVNWDGAVEAWDIPNGDILRELYGGFQFTGGAANGDAKVVNEAGWGWEFQAARATTIATDTVYEQIVELGRKLDENEIPETDRHVTGTPHFISILKDSSDIGTVAVEQAYAGVIVNGRVMRVSGFDIHMAAGSRVSTRLEKSTATADIVLSDGSRASQILANHISFCTFGYKWAESRIVDAEDQFAKKYQALHLFGALVPGIRRRAGANLFGKI
ncbi:MAG: hypothetical protein CL489_03440 [Acidobacteria bacterium]|nr:hypothetical protein [Acidobacteriota bacterium]